MKKFKKLFIIIFAFLIITPILSGCEFGRIANDRENFTIVIPAPTRYTVNVINGSGSNLYDENTQATVISNHNSFGYWYTNDINTPVSFEKSYTFTVTQNTTITATNSFVGMSFAMFDSEVNAQNAKENITNATNLNNIDAYTGYVANSFCTGGSDGYLLQDGTHTVVNATTISLTSTINVTSGYLVAFKKIKIGDNYSTVLQGVIQYVDTLTPTFNYVCQDNITYYFTFNLVNPI